MSSSQAASMATVLSGLARVKTAVAVFTPVTRVPSSIRPFDAGAAVTVGASAEPVMSKVAAAWAVRPVASMTWTVKVSLTSWPSARALVAASVSSRR